jgi:hypothetical protein
MSAFSGARGIRAIVLGAALSFTALTAIFATNFDFRAFYCAGTTVRMHANPYHTEPLHTCERTRTDRAFAVFAREVALPAPQPGYDMALFAAFAALPFAAASKLWTALLAACAFGAILLVQRLTRLGFAAVLAAFWLSLCMTSLYLGELIPLSIAAIAAAAYCARTQRWALAGIAAAASLAEPHIGLPICAAVALWAPRARLALGVSIAALAGISLAALGAAQNVEYVAAVLPAHALSELGSDAQFSLSVILHALGIPDALALKAGSLSYALASLFGISLARTLALRFRDDALLIAAPAATAVIGGVFMHVTEIAAAIPLTLLLLVHVKHGRGYVLGALVLLAIPWWSLVTPMLLSPLTGIAFAAMIVTYLVWAHSGKAALAIACGAGAFAAAAGLVHWYAVSSNAFAPHVLPSGIDAVYPEASWAYENARYLATGVPASWLLRAPTWLALLAVALLAAAVALPARLALRKAIA